MCVCVSLNIYSHETGEEVMRGQEKFLKEMGIDRVKAYMY